jgi:TRAP-type C4-dicarboxylate transport system permease small subunit
LNPKRNILSKKRKKSLPDFTEKNKFFKTLDLIDKIVSKLEGLILASGVAAMAVNSIAAVISRFIFNDALTFTDELNMIFIVMVTFAGLSYAARNGRHIRMSAIYDALPLFPRKILMIFISLLTTVFMFFLSFYSCIYIMDLYESGRILPALGIPVFYIYLWVPAGFFITALQYLFTTVKNIREPGIHLSTTLLDGYCDTEKEIKAKI